MRAICIRLSRPTTLEQRLDPCRRDHHPQIQAAHVLRRLRENGPSLRRRTTRPRDGVCADFPPLIDRALIERSEKENATLSIDNATFEFQSIGKLVSTEFTMERPSSLVGLCRLFHPCPCRLCRPCRVGRRAFPSSSCDLPGSSRQTPHDRGACCRSCHTSWSSRP
jgi:hypothetical protein